MSIEGLVGAAIITGILALWMASPFFESSRTEDKRLRATSVERQRERLLIYYERVLHTLHDLDEDYALGKLNERDYQTEREGWVQRGIQVLKAIDELDEAHLVAPTDADDASIDEAIDRKIEEAVAD
jgi:hypothetical protein